MFDDYYRCKKNKAKHAYWFLGDVKTDKISFDVRNNFGYLDKSQRNFVCRFLDDNKVEYRKYPSKEILISLNSDLVNLAGGKNKKKRYVSKYVGSEYFICHEKEVDDELKISMLAVVKRWDVARHHVYRRYTHTGFDVNFIKNHLDLSSVLLFTLRDALWNVRGFSIFTIPHDGFLCCPLRKTDYSGVDLDFYFDIETFRWLRREYDHDLVLNWGASKGSLLAYKKKFDVYSLNQIYFINSRKKDGV
jgi:hypothetical protein